MWGVTRESMDGYVCQHIRVKELGLNSINEKAAVLHRHGGARALEKERGKTPNGHAAAVRGGYQVVMVAVGCVCVCCINT